MNAQTTLMTAMAVSCKKCGELFDLSYDLEQGGDSGDVMSVLRSKLTRRAALCWKCRNT